MPRHVVDPSATTPVRIRTTFHSGDDECVGWHYRGTNGACVVMAGGLALTKETATDRFATRFHRAGFSVLAFDYRRLGESSGTPRLALRPRDMRDDWCAAIAHAATLPEVDPTRIALWAFSLSGGLILEVAADAPVAAAIAQAPNADGRAATRNALRHTTFAATARLMSRALLDTVAGWFGAPPRLVALTGERGSVAVLTTPDAADARHALDAAGSAASIAARAVPALGRYRPGRAASRIKCPLLVVAYSDDTTALVEPAREVARAAPCATLVELPGAHYAAFLDGFDATVSTELDFLETHLLHPAHEAGVHDG